MKENFRKFPIASAGVLSFILLIPFIILELVNRWKFNERFPFSVFIFAWVLQIVFILLLTPLIKNVYSGKSLLENPMNFLFRGMCLVIIAYIWGGWIVDQWPCLMGVPNCD